jgi:transcriptional regulator with XRE-family HTH domain
MPRRDVSPDPRLAMTLRRLREERGLTREEVAYKSGVTTASLARIELGQASPAWVTVRDIIGALDVSLAALAKAIEAEPRD